MALGDVMFVSLLLDGSFGEEGLMKIESKGILTSCEIDESVTFCRLIGESVVTLPSKK